MDIEVEYFSIFGKEIRPTLYDVTDEEYLALRRQIMEAPKEHYDKRRLPFTKSRAAKPSRVHEKLILHEKIGELIAILVNISTSK